jgi:hypothetical protein
MKHNFLYIKSAKARVTGTIPYCHGKVIEVIEPTDKCCISLNIAEGLGRTETFHVYVNDTQQFTTCKVSNDEYTICTVLYYFFYLRKTENVMTL